MMGQEETIRVGLTARADEAPIRIDGNELLGRIYDAETRRRRTKRTTLAAVAIVVTVGGVGSWALARPRSEVVYALPKQNSASPASWGGITWQMPPGWLVTELGSEVRYYRAGSMVQGPFVSTVPVPSMCRATESSTECNRAFALSPPPADGAIAWFSAGPAVAADGTDRDTGPTVDEAFCGVAGAAPFHAYRQLKSAQGDTRVTVDGCIYGPHTSTLTAELQSIANSVNAATVVPSETAQP